MAYEGTKPWKCEHISVNEKTKVQTKCNNVAKDAHNDLDIDTIIAGCDSVVSQVGQLNSLIKTLDYYSSSITKESLSVDGSGVEYIASQCLENITTQTQAIIDHANGVKGSAIDAFESLQKQYNELAQIACDHGE